MTSFIDWLFGPVVVRTPTKEELHVARGALDKAIAAQQQVQKLVDYGIEESERVSRSLQVLTQALDLAASKKDEYE